ncbi:hypothetical protein PG994_012178 [Apiospora phragmitis]|uniref:Uncharacterized protein n=1 Tax=Apiospora phragmitis TaxID=2905665 RepID=A0ABR1TXJ0_9PEZI
MDASFLPRKPQNPSSLCCSRTTAGTELGSKLTINTLVAMLSTGAKAALLFPVAECISQIKWIWFSSEEPRRLSDMSSFR